VSLFKQFYSNLYPHVLAVISSDLLRGYLRQFSGRIAYIVQKDLPSDSYFRNGQTFGSLQHAPHWTHRPLRFLTTGRTDVRVLLHLADHVFLCPTVIADDSTNNKPKSGVLNSRSARDYCFGGG
jgi:hypothetical protein